MIVFVFSVGEKKVFFNKKKTKRFKKDRWEPACKTFKENETSSVTSFEQDKGFWIFIFTKRFSLPPFLLYII